MKPISLTRPARTDLRNIWEFVSQESTDSADRLVTEIAAAIDKHVAPFPESYRLRTDLGYTTVRSMNYRTWVIFYRVRGRDVQILRIVHGGRDLTRLKIVE